MLHFLAMYRYARAHRARWWLYLAFDKAILGIFKPTKLKSYFKGEWGQAKVENNIRNWYILQWYRFYNTRKAY